VPRTHWTASGRSICWRAITRCGARAAGDRVDHVSIDPAGLEPKGFDAAIYKEQAAVAREGLALLKNPPPARRAILEEVAALGDFLANSPGPRAPRRERQLPLT
jgi:hypothetical protein